MHVVSNLKFALKAIHSGVDAIVCEGFEAGGHNGIEETTTFCLIPLTETQSSALMTENYYVHYVYFIPDGA